MCCDNEHKEFMGLDHIIDKNPLPWIEPFTFSPPFRGYIYCFMSTTIWRCKEEDFMDGPWERIAPIDTCPARV